MDGESTQDAEELASLPRKFTCHWGMEKRMTALNGESNEQSNGKMKWNMTCNLVITGIKVSQK